MGRNDGSVLVHRLDGLVPAVVSEGSPIETSSSTSGFYKLTYLEVGLAKLRFLICVSPEVACFGHVGERV